MGLGIGSGPGGRRAGAGRPRGVKTRWPSEIAAELHRLAEAIQRYTNTVVMSTRRCSRSCVAS